MREQLANTGKQPTILIIRMLPPMTYYDERERSIPETHLHPSAFNHCGRSCADRLPSPGRSDTTEDKFEKQTVPIIKIKLYIWAYIHTSNLSRFKAGKHARDTPGNSHVPPLLLLCSCQMEGLFIAQWKNYNEHLKITQ